jgi:predicted NAD-dependent protein-ADP-ribosyltransferase YbiA (DUF1768 family)
MIFETNRRLSIIAIASLISACAHTGSAEQSRYPAVWFAPVHDTNPPSWEIFPQAALPGEVILSKRNELGILSNFARSPFLYRGKRYESIEGFWQMMFFPEGRVDGKKDPRLKLPAKEWRYTREQVSSMTAFEAKKAGDLGEKNAEKLRIDWVSFEGRSVPYRSEKPGTHYRLIREAMIEKLKQNPEVRRVLVATGDLVLRPDHLTEINPPPEWKYYEIWMELRSLVREGLL